MKMNIKLLKKIQEQIRRTPKQFVMHSFFTRKRSCNVIEKIPNCGTAACIAGWAIALDSKLTPDKARLDSALYLEEAEFARKLLKLSPKESKNLFYEDNWPDEFRDLYNNEDSREYLAKLPKRAVARIKHFIKTGQ